MSNFLKPMGYLAMVAASAGGAGYSPEINGQGVNVTATIKDERPAQLPRPPLKIPMPLDKAGYKVDVTFEVPASMLRNGLPYLNNHLIGLRVLFAPGATPETKKIFEALEERPLAVRIFLSRLEENREVRIPLFDSKLVSSIGTHPRRYEAFEIPDGKAMATQAYVEHSGAPRGTPDASTLVLSLAGSRMAVTPGVYRFQAETLEDAPVLTGITAFFVYEENPKR